MSYAPATLGEPVPAVCLVSDVCRFLRLSRRSFQRAMAKKELPLVELAPIGRTRRFTGESVDTIRRGRWAQRRTA
jgi:hypothetical protein